jgi:3-dehydroquinate dehydratase/shikimate dehydrogenase
MNQTALIVPLTQTTPAGMRAAMARARSAGADMVECRLDYLDNPTAEDVAAILRDKPLPVIATCRPVRQGGRFAGDEAARLALLKAAAWAGAEYIDIESDVPPERWPAGRRILSHHDFAAGAGERVRSGQHEDMAAHSAAVAPRSVAPKSVAPPTAAVRKIAFAAAGPEDALTACAILHHAERPMIAVAMGEAGLASRILARKFGAFGTFAALDAGEESAPGQLTLAQMKQLYRWDAIGPDTAVYGVVGHPVAHSMSPAIHNAAFAAAGIDAVYVPLLVQTGAENFTRFMDALARSQWAGFGGLSVTIPHKEHALLAVGEARVDELARRIGAINTIRLEPGGELSGWNTDYAAAIDALCAGMGIARDDLRGRAVAVIGAGGAARAIVAALCAYGAEVTIYNRTAGRAVKLAAEFGADAEPLSALGDLQAEIVVNCTSIGMHPHVGDTPLPANVLGRVKVVFDTVYNPLQTRLLLESAAAGCACVSGLEMFVNQAVDQPPGPARGHAPGRGGFAVLISAI